MIFRTIIPIKGPVGETYSEPIRHAPRNSCPGRRICRFYPAAALPTGGTLVLGGLALSHSASFFGNDLLPGDSRRSDAALQRGRPSAVGPARPLGASSQPAQHAGTRASPQRCVQASRTAAAPRRAKAVADCRGFVHNVDSFFLMIPPAELWRNDRSLFRGPAVDSS